MTAASRYQVNEEPLCGCATCTSKSLFIYLTLCLLCFCEIFASFILNGMPDN